MKTIDLGFLKLPYSFNLDINLKDYGLSNKRVFTTVSCSCVEIDKSLYIGEGGTFKVKIHSKSSLVEKNIKKIYFYVEEDNKKNYFQTIELIYK